MGVIVGVLSLLVGLLVGWQIYKTIEVDKKIESVESRYRDMLSKLGIFFLSSKAAWLYFSTGLKTRSITFRLAMSIRDQSFFM